MNWLNQHKKMLMVTGLAVIITGMLIFYSLYRVNASEQFSSQTTTPNPEAIADLNNGDTASTTTDEPDSSEVASENGSMDISEISKAAHTYLHAGWLHFIKENTSDTDRGSKGILDNGNVLSANSVWECWLRLDDALSISESVCIQTNMDSSVIQVGVRSGNVIWNSSTDEIIEYNDAFSPYIPDIDTLSDQAARNNVILSIESIVDEKEKVQISYSSEESSPVPLWDYDNPVTGFEYIYTFDPETGMMLIYQEWVTFEDSSRRMIEQSIHKIFEIVEEAPDEIKAYLLIVKSKN